MVVIDHKSRKGVLGIFGKRTPIAGKFKVCSLESIDTNEQDFDVGVVRVSGSMLDGLGGRNALVKVSVDGLSGRKNSVVRIVRAATGKKALEKDEIALQYDDRQLLGIKSAGSVHNISIRPVCQITNQFRFLWGHTSPLVRMNAYFAVSLTVTGTILGLIVGVIIGGG